MTDRDLLALLRGPIRSVASLELLLLLRSRAPQSWSSEQLVHELRSSRSQVEGTCARLIAAGLLRVDDAQRYTYAPVSETLDSLCAELADIYRERPVSVITALFSTDDRLRSFAEAFRLKGKDE